MIKTGGKAEGKDTGFVRMDKITSAKLLWHLRNKSIIFRVCKNGANGRYSIRSYRLFKRNGRDRLFMWAAYHSERISENFTRSAESEAASFEELMALIADGYISAGIVPGNELRLIFDYILGDELEKEHPEGSEYFFYRSDNASRFGKGIEQEFAAYWFGVVIGRQRK